MTVVQEGKRRQMDNYFGINETLSQGLEQKIATCNFYNIKTYI